MSAVRGSVARTVLFAGGKAHFAALPVGESPAAHIAATSVDDVMNTAEQERPR